MLEKWNSLPKSEKERRTKIQQNKEKAISLSSVDRYWKDYQRAPDEGKPEQMLIFSVINKIAPVYQEWIDTAMASPTMPRWLPMLTFLGAERVADVVCRSVLRLFLGTHIFTNLNTSSGAPAYAPTAQAVSKVIADDCINIYSYLKTRKKSFKDWKSQSKYVKNWTPKRCLAFTKKMKGMEKYTRNEKENIGHALLRIALSTDIFTTHYQRVKSGRKTSLVIAPSKDILFYLSKQHKVLQDTFLVHRPMIIPPVPHGPIHDGGELLKENRKGLIRRATPTDKDSRFKMKRPPNTVLSGVNTIMNTEWAINVPVLTIMETLFKNNSRKANLPSYDNNEYAFRRAYPKTGTKIEQAIWMKDASEAWGDWYKDEQARARMLVRLDLANDLAEYNLFYMPVTLDFRGRAYSTCELLSCQGMDYDRALICFSIPKRLTSIGKEWLKIHIANLFDKDKLPFTERLKWVDDNMSMLAAIANDPYTTLDLWSDSKKKKNASFQRLAAVLELFREDGMTQLPIQMDGANNGSQHWSAIMKDKELGKLCNLMNNEIPNDLYQTVADTATSLLMPTENSWHKLFLDHWNNKIPRSVTKRPTMCEPYGITFYGIQKYLKEEGHLNWVPKETREAAVVELAKIIQKSLSTVMLVANGGKEWLRSVARQFEKEDLPLTWTTPSGFVVHHLYNKVSTRVSYTTLYNKKQLIFSYPIGTLDHRAQYLGISPNYIHSLDAAHMFLVVNKAVNAGMSCFSFVHDSYGTYANDIDLLQKITREEFARMHKDNNLEKLKDELEDTYSITLPAIPTCSNTLSIREVLDSPYFFS